jgi:hypothetical protein
MKSFSVRAVLVLLITFFSFLAPASGICDQYLDEIQNKIKNLEQKESDCEAAINFWKETLSLLQSGNYVIYPSEESVFVGLPVPKNIFTEWVTLETFSGVITPDLAQGRARLADRLTREMLAQAPGEISRLEGEHEKIKNELTSLLDERARLRESGAPGNQLGGDGSRPIANQSHTPLLGTRLSAEIGDGSRPIANQPGSGIVISGPFGTYETLHTHVGCTKPNKDCNDNKPYIIRFTITKRGDGKVQVDLDPPSITLVGDLNGTDYVFTYNGYGRGEFQFTPDFSSFTGTFEDDNGHKGKWTGNKLKE